MKNQPTTPEPTPRLEYCISMLAELAPTARLGGFPMLEYLIDMALAEAIDIQRGVRPAAPKTSLGP